mmetsp:Transcript_929/g.3148  ORF Transcript_929/g.3148 Transcript_929/m.3148 type:complete len:99 (-) Transcript_929:152-448(-)
MASPSLWEGSREDDPSKEETSHDESVLHEDEGDDDDGSGETRDDVSVKSANEASDEVPSLSAVSGFGAASCRGCLRARMIGEFTRTASRSKVPSMLST